MNTTHVRPRVFYSASTGSFYLEGLDYLGGIPGDAVEISEGDHRQLVSGQCDGKLICADKKGRPYLADPPAPTLEALKAAKKVNIDAETRTAIVAGFSYEIDGEPLHFSYDAHDQQNFADSAAQATLSLVGKPGPETFLWKGRMGPDENGDFSVVPLSLSPEQFLDLYLHGALAHKAACLDQGSARKRRLDAAQTPEEVAEV